MTLDDAIQLESSQRQHFDTIIFNEQRDRVTEESILCRFALLKPKIFRDGDQWCVLYGDDLHSGIAGFGKSPRAAIMEWNAAWDAPIANKGTK